jgi:hypothetical protein
LLARGGQRSFADRAAPACAETTEPFGARDERPLHPARVPVLPYPFPPVAARAFDRGTALIQRKPARPDFSETDFSDFSQEEFEEHGPQTHELGDDTGDAARKTTDAQSVTVVRKPGVMACTPQSPGEQFLRKLPRPEQGANVQGTLRFNDRVFVLARGGQDEGWYEVVSASGAQGWVPASSVALEPPAPTALLYRVQGGDTALELASRWYAAAGGFRRWWLPGAQHDDGRFYVSALAFANEGRAGMPSPENLGKRGAWADVGLTAGLTVWKPDKEFLQTLRGKVSSGSISRELWEDTKRTSAVLWDWAVSAAAFYAGYHHGVLESVYDLFAGIVDLVVMVWDVLKSLLTGNIAQDAQELWNELKGLDVSKLGDELLGKWNAPDAWDSGFFRGRVVGYVIAEIAMMLVSGGATTALKVAGKFATIGKLISKLSKAQKIVKGTAQLAKRLPDKARSFLAKLSVKGASKQARKIRAGIDKGKAAIEGHLKSAQHLKARAAAYQRYVARGGTKPPAEYGRMYDVLERNRRMGKLAEEQFQLVMGGKPKEFVVTVGKQRVVRKVDNFLGNVAREIKSGYLVLSDFTKQQILKDMQLIKTQGLKVEWHLLGGGEPKAIAALKKAGIDVILH